MSSPLPPPSSTAPSSPPRSSSISPSPASTAPPSPPSISPYLPSSSTALPPPPPPPPSHPPPTSAALPPPPPSRPRRTFRGMFIHQYIPPPPPRSPPRPMTFRAKLKIIISVLLIGFLLAAFMLTATFVTPSDDLQFTVVAASINHLNATTFPNPAITSSFNLTISTRNPNPTNTIYYKQLSVGVAWKSSLITTRADLPHFHHKPKTTVDFSPVVVVGNGVSVPMAAVDALEVDKVDGVVGVGVEFSGSLRWNFFYFITILFEFLGYCDFEVGLDNQTGLLKPIHCRGIAVS